MSATATRPPRPVDVVALQYARPNRMVGIPLYVLLAVVVITVVVAALILRSGSALGQSTGNGSIVWSVLGYTIALGVQNVATNFPLALALGSTRRTFVLGTLLTDVAQALLVAVATIVLRGVEAATGGWFIGVHVLVVEWLGGGSLLVLAVAVFLSVLLALAIGGLYGASWTRFGAPGPLLLSVGIAAVILLAIVLGIGAPIVTLPWAPAVGAAVVIVLALLGQYLLLRRASVR